MMWPQLNSQEELALLPRATSLQLSGQDKPVAVQTLANDAALDTRITLQRNVASYTGNLEKELTGAKL